MEQNEKMVFVKWAKEKIFRYKLIASLTNEKGALADFLAFLAKQNIDLTSIELGKDNLNYIHYCDIVFQSEEADINTLRAKIESKIKVVELVRSDDAYRN
ncbi:MAG: hypothetical protein P8Y16_07425 [Sulfurimonas sp.]